MPSRPRSLADDRARAEALRLFELVTGAVDAPPAAAPGVVRLAWPRLAWQRLAAALKSRADAADTRSQTADDTAALPAPSHSTR